MKISIKDYIAVRNFLADDFDKIMDLILEADHYICCLFEVDEIILELSKDPEDGYHTLCAGIPYKRFGGDLLLDRFDDLWFIDNLHRFKGKVLFDLVIEG